MSANNIGNNLKMSEKNQKRKNQKHVVLSDEQIEEITQIIIQGVSAEILKPIKNESKVTSILKNTIQSAFCWIWLLLWPVLSGYLFYEYITHQEYISHLHWEIEHARNEIEDAWKRCRDECGTFRDLAIAQYQMCKNKYEMDTRKEYNHTEVFNLCSNIACVLVFQMCFNKKKQRKLSFSMNSLHFDRFLGLNQMCERIDFAILIYQVSNNF